MLAPRKERRQLAKDLKVDFVPEYNGTPPQTYKEMYGLDSGRFNNKYIKFDQKEVVNTTKDQAKKGFFAKMKEKLKGKTVSFGKRNG